MAGIMELFAAELAKFKDGIEKTGWEAAFDDTRYPASMVMRQIQPPLYLMEEWEEPEQRAQIKVMGLPDIEVVTSGNLQMSKKDLNKMIKDAGQLLTLYMHGYLQDAKAAELDG